MDELLSMNSVHIFWLIISLINIKLELLVLSKRALRLMRLRCLEMSASRHTWVCLLLELWPEYKPLETELINLRQKR